MIEPTKLVLIGTRTTYQATGDAGTWPPVYSPNLEQYSSYGVHIAGDSPPPFPVSLVLSDLSRRNSSRFFPRRLAVYVSSRICVHKRFESYHTCVPVAVRSLQNGGHARTHWVSLNVDG